MRVGNELFQVQKQILSAGQIQSLQVLSLNNADLDLLLRSEYMENPMLESVREGRTSARSEHIRQWQNDKVNVSEDIETYLWEQLAHRNYTELEKQVIGFLINCLDDNGFYQVPVEEAAECTGAPPEMVGSCLKDLKELEPYGIFSSGLSECLLRQLDMLGVEEEPLREIIRDYLEELSQGKIAQITRSMKISSAQVRKYQSFIVTLNPRPLAGFGKGGINYVIPDVIVSVGDDGYEITLNDEWIGNYGLSDFYLRMAMEAEDPELTAYFAEKKKRAMLLINAVEQRRKTLIRITESIIEIQGGRLVEKHRLKPMTMKDVAERAGVHSSTVSRAVKDKYIQYPEGAVLMKELFSAGISGGDDDDLNAAGVKKELNQLIEEEDKSKPYSDSKLAELLKEKGIILSRRSVAKYRDELGFKGSRQRRE